MKIIIHGLLYSFCALFFVTPIWAELSENAQVVATGFNNPRGLAFDPHGIFLYVSEAGLGGTTSTEGICDQAPPHLGPITGGNTGRISVVTPHGKRYTVADGLPSSQTQFLDALGPVDIEFLNHKIIVLIQAGCSKGNVDLPNSIVSLKKNKIKLLVDISDYNINNPQNFSPDDDQDPEGSPYSIKVNHHDEVIIVEANRSTIIKMDHHGKLSKLADLAEFIQGYDTPVAIDIDKEGNVYIGSFGEHPFLIGSSAIYKITHGGDISIFSEGFTSIIDLAFNRKGELYILETSTTNTGEFPFLFRDSGRITKLSSDGTRTVVATGLDFPTAMTIGPSGAIYVSNRGHGLGLSPGLGEIVKIDP